MSHLLEIFYAAHCAGCPEARRAVRQFASSRRDVVVVEHDLELARRYRLISTPALVLDGDVIMYGVPRPAALAARVDAGHRAPLEEVAR